jgi:hypothetical protein
MTAPCDPHDLSEVQERFGATGSTLRGPLFVRLFSRCEADDGGCWLFTGHLDKKGYGSICEGGGHGRMLKAHRVSYELLAGPIPDDLQLDHLCRVRHCVNPCHLEPVTSRENTLRGDTIPAQNARKTHCPQGHGYTLDNTLVSVGRRYCRRCMRARESARAARKRATA